MRSITILFFPLVYGSPTDESNPDSSNRQGGIGFGGSASISFSFGTSFQLPGLGGINGGPVIPGIPGFGSGFSGASGTSSGSFGGSGAVANAGSGNFGSNLVGSNLPISGYGPGNLGNVPFGGLISGILGSETIANTGSGSSGGSYGEGNYEYVGPSSTTPTRSEEKPSGNTSFGDLSGGSKGSEVITNTGSDRFGGNNGESCGGPSSTTTGGSSSSASHTDIPIET